MSGSQRRRPRRFSVLAVGFALLVSLAPTAAAGPTGFDEQSGGRYNGWAVAAGTTEAPAGTGRVVMTGNFMAEMWFTVPIPSGPTTGTWDLLGDSSMTLGGFRANSVSAIMTHQASGEIEGNRQQLNLGIATISTSGTATLDRGIGQPPLVVPLSASESVGPFEMTVSHILCDDVSGEWVLSWNTELSDASFTPTFRGSWSARRLPMDDASEGRLSALMPKLEQLNQEVTKALQDGSMINGTPILPFDVLWGLIKESVALINELNNLSLCDQALLGPDQVQRYINALTANLTTLVQVLLDNLRLADDASLTGEALMELATMLAGIGGIGEGAVRDEVARQAEDALQAEAERVFGNDDSLISDPVVYGEMFGWGD